LDLELEKSELIEELGVYFETNKILSHLAARIFSLLILSEKDGTTFDELVTTLKASKSSVSTNLQLLQNTGRVIYFTKLGDRKRYFKAAPNDIIVQLDKKIAQWEQEKQLHEKLFAFKTNLYKEHNKYDENLPGLQYTKNYALFINDFIKNLKTLKNNLQNTLN